eukprot:TRINITY_DN543_c0_g1_i6.p1 TRINITY_DN543_c0_g1~~TRINITY_DN543_c0_g1_i6.p1  ORF type:complete len:159 (-),score=29.40 TRINITY_DN543_c0_g1_i6:51-527(-)
MMEGDDKMTVEVRNEHGHVVRQYEATREEISAAPHLLEARRLISQGKPSEALGKILDVVRSTQGEAGVWRVLEEAKKSLSSKTEENTTMDMEDHAPPPPEPSQPELEHIAFLSAQGKDQIMRDAYMDGSSSICPLCRGLISKKRLESHLANWCPAKNL